MKLREIIKKIIKEETRKMKNISESISNSSWITVVWESGSMKPEPLAYFVSNHKNALDDIGQGEIADILQDELGRKINSSDFEVESSMTFADFQDEYGNRNNPNRIDLNRYPEIKI